MGTESPHDIRSLLREGSSGRTGGGSHRARASSSSRGRPSDPLTRSIVEAFESAVDNKALTRAILDAARDAVVVTDLSGRVVEWNPASERTFGYTRDHARGRELADLIVPERLRDAHRAGLARQVRTGKSEILGKRVEMPGMRADGSEVPIELTVTRVRGAQPLFAGHMRDITERRAKDAELQDEAKRRSAILELGRHALEGSSQELIQCAVRLAAESLELDFCQLWELCPDGGVLWLRAAVGWDEGLVDQVSVPIDDPSQPAFTFGADDPVVVEDFRLEERLSPPSQLAERGVVSGLSVRIPGPDQGLGVIGGHTMQRREFSAAEVSFMSTLGQLLGAAIVRSRFDQRLGEAERKYRSLVERLPVVTYVAETGMTGRWRFVSPQIEQMLGYTPQEWTQNPDLWAQRIHPEDRERVEAVEERFAAEGGLDHSEYRMLARDGSVVWVRDSASLVGPGDGPRVVEGLLADITEEKQAEQRLRHLATHDDLSGLRNRRCFGDDLASHLADGSGRGAVLLLDLDHLKFVNDSLGHAVGDRVLRGMAELLQGVEFEGALPARFGGDQFAVLLPDASEAQARDVAGTLVELVRSHGAVLPVTASVGVVPFDDLSPVTAPDLLVAADLALGDAKEGGRDRVAVLSGRADHRLAWVERVRSAIEDDRLALYAQPIVDLETGAVRRHELLIRMLAEDGSVIPPAAFLPAAERFGLIREIDRWVIARALEMVEQGQRVAVNLSGKSINDAKLMDQVEWCLGKQGVEPGALMFEVTETAAATTMEQLGKFSARIERLGCKLVLDDFGTGFGTFTYLRHLPVHGLKIDTQFVRGMAHSEPDRRIVRSIVAAGNALGLKIVGEGVEDARTLDLLRDYGVGFAQGYHLGRPRRVTPTLDQT